MTKRSQFEDAEHELAKMIVRAVNTLRDNVRYEGTCHVGGGDSASLKATCPSVATLERAGWSRGAGAAV